MVMFGLLLDVLYHCRNDIKSLFSTNPDYKRQALCFHLYNTYGLKNPETFNSSQYVDIYVITGTQSVIGWWFVVHRNPHTSLPQP